MDPKWGPRDVCLCESMSLSTAQPPNKAQLQGSKGKLLGPFLSPTVPPTPHYFYWPEKNPSCFKGEISGVFLLPTQVQPQTQAFLIGERRSSGVMLGKDFKAGMRAHVVRSHYHVFWPKVSLVHVLFPAPSNKEQTLILLTKRSWVQESVKWDIYEHDFHKVL